MLAGFASVAAHGGVLLLVLTLAGARVARQPALVELTPIQVVEPPPPEPPPASPGHGTQLRPIASTNAGTLGRRGHDAPPRSQTHAPAAVDPLADVVVSYETPTGLAPGNEAGATGAGIGAGLFGDGTGHGAGGGAFGVGAVPPVPAPSLARPPRPRTDYHKWDFRAAPAFAGATVRVELSIDPGGSVRQVRVLKGVDDYVDRRAADVARRFEFYPALNDAGQPTWGLHRWEFVIVSNALDFHFEPRR